MSEAKLLKQINKRIKQSPSKDQLVQLELDSISIRSFTKDIKNLIEAYPKIQYLTLNDCQLLSLNNFPYLPNLSILQLSHNLIQDDELFHLLKNSHISHLMIDENKLKSLEKISILRQLPNLQQLQIDGNLIGESDFYRDQLFDKIPHLKIIDCHDKYGNIAIESQNQDQQEICSIKKHQSSLNQEIDQSDQQQEKQQNLQNKYENKKQTGKKNFSRQSNQLFNLLRRQQFQQKNESFKDKIVFQQSINSNIEEEDEQQYQKEDSTVDGNKKRKFNQFLQLSEIRSQSQKGQAKQTGKVDSIELQFSVNQWNQQKN